MRKILLCLAIGVLGCMTNVQAEQKITVTGDHTLGTGMSPNGKYVVGNNPGYYVYGINAESYLYNVETEDLKWLTEFDEEDPGKCGQFMDVSDDGVIAGTFKDPDFQIDSYGEIAPLSMAAVWKDGQVTSLGLGDFNLSDFQLPEDGSFANAISGDGKTVVGYIGIGNDTYAFPYVWKEGNTGEWVSSRLPLPQDAVGGKVTDVSADGNIITGLIWYSDREVAVYWQNGEYFLIEGTGTDTQYNGEYTYSRASAVSPNGKYIAFIFGKKEPGVYDVDQKSYRKITPFEPDYAPGNLAIDNNGNVVGSFDYGNIFIGTYKRPFWYSYSDNRIIGFDHFMDLFAPDVEPPFTFVYEEQTQVVPRAISADGVFIMGNNNIGFMMTPECWMLQTENGTITFTDTPDEVKVKSLNLKEVTLTWEKDEKVYEGLTLESYNIYCDGEKINNIAVTDAKELSYVHKNVQPGYPAYSVASVFKTTDGLIVESPKSNPVVIAIADTYALPLFDSFDSQSLQTNYWTEQSYYGDKQDGKWGAVPYMGIYDCSLFWSMSANTPYSSGLISRPMDASQEDYVSLSFVIEYGLLNVSGQQIDKDSLSIDVSVDSGSTWTEVKTMSFKDLSQYWGMQTVDLSQWVAKKIFQVRLRKHGQGVAQYYCNIDLFKVGATPEEAAPKGLTGEVTGAKQVNLVWKNPFNAYQLNYINEFYLPGLAIGDEGKEFIAANSFDAKDLSMYKGKYITSVSANINHNPDVEYSEDTHASIVIFENGTKIREQEVENIVYNEFNTVVLDEPVLLDGTKEIKVGLKIYDYDERQIPISYQNTYNFVPGKSDLYSQDGGKTWKKLSDYYVGISGHETDGYCNWNITANVTDEATVNPADVIYDDNLMAYNIFRNGEKINNRLIDSRQARFTDTEASDNCYYEVVAYYYDGSVSDISDRYTFGMLTSIHDTDANNGLRVYPNPAVDYINITGDFDKVTLLSVNGQAVFSTNQSTLSLAGLPSGVYFLRIESGDKIETIKVLIKK